MDDKLRKEFKSVQKQLLYETGNEKEIAFPEYWNSLNEAFQDKEGLHCVEYSESISSSIERSSPPSLNSPSSSLISVRKRSSLNSPSSSLISVRKRSPSKSPSVLGRQLIADRQEAKDLVIKDQRAARKKQKTVVEVGDGLVLMANALSTLGSNSSNNNGIIEKLDMLSNSISESARAQQKQGEQLTTVLTALLNRMNQ